MKTDTLLDLFNDLIMNVRFCLGLKKYLSEKMTLQEARQIIKNDMQKREENFINLIRKGIFGYKKSPYLLLFELSHYEFKDVERLVLKHGIEGALKILRDDGVYFSIDEFKGRKPVVRKGKSFIIREKDFDNPYTLSCYKTKTGGTRSAGTRIALDFEFLTQHAAHHGMIADIWNLKDLPQLHLLPPFPFGIAMKNMLALSKLDIYFLKWISLVNKRNIKFSLKSKVGFFYIMLLNKILGEGLIRPEFLDYKDIIKAVEFVDNILKKYKGCCIQTNISSAVRFCLVAQDNGISLEGLRFRCSGEPVTNAKNKIIEGSNAKYILHYALTEAGVVGSRCLRPTSVDDIHLFKGSFALISHIRQVKDANIDVFLLTTLLPFAPKILLNVEPGDYGKIETRKCGCPYDEFGLYDHIYDIRSFEKLCGDGATFFGPELMRIIEEILPSRFGGSNLDYQFVEKEDIDGLTRLFVYINPDINNIDEGNILATIIGELKKKGEKYEVMAEVWARLGTIKVIRKHPIITEKGKLYPLHILSGS